MKPRLFIAILIACATTPAHAQHEHAAPRIGTVDFAVSCTRPAQALFNRAIAWLHSFEYQEAEKSFLEASAADARCAMSRWGVAMAQFHPLWAPPSAAELAKGTGAIAEARKLAGVTDRERDYIAALDAFYRDAGRLDHRARTLAYVDAMAGLHRRYPSDDEAAVFYALALVAAGTMDDDKSFARETAAARILNGVLARKPDHPGVAHYLIHGYDYPELAQLALPAARRYAAIAPASAHAQHMPSHIFTRLGLWEAGIRSNLQAEAAARAYAVRHKLPGAWDERLHAMDYLVYGYLQLGQDAKARQVLDELNAIRRVDPPNFKVAYAFSAIPARFALERRRWDEAAALTLPPNASRIVPWSNFRWAEAHILFARAIGAARGGKLEPARQDLARLAEIGKALGSRAGEYDWAKQVEIQRQVAAAWLAAGEGRTDPALALMRSAADLDDATEKHPVTPGAVLPTREQLGELLLTLDRPADALVAFEESLRRTPGRLAGTYGAARAARLAGNRAKAREHYTVLAALCGEDCSRPELAEARAYVAAPSAP
jgi:hypothetical protein